MSRLIRFSLDCGEPSINAGMSIPLLSVCLATIMALFRDSELSLSVSLDDLAFLIQESGTALLDPRLASTSDLEEEMRSQMVRAINKVRLKCSFVCSSPMPACQFFLTLSFVLLFNSWPCKRLQVLPDT